MVYLAAFLVFAVIGSQLSPDKKEEKQAQQNETAAVTNKPEIPALKYPRMTLKEYRNEAQATRQDIVKNYLASVPFDGSHFDIFYSCLSQMSYTKNTDLTLNEVLGWCKADFDRSISALNDRINFDNFIDNFSSWDGSFRPLERQIKNDMNDSDSYSHVSTTFRADINAAPPVAFVTTVFSGKNRFNATVKQRAIAKVNISIGDIISFEYQ